VDDDDSKVRRNVVVASALVCLVTWLKLPVAALASRFLTQAGTAATPGTGLPALDSQRIWLAVLIALVYLGMRYRFSADGKSGWQALAVDWANALESLSRAMLKRAAWRHTRFGWESRLFKDSLRDITRRWNTEAQEHQGEPKVTDVMRPRLVIQAFTFDREKYGGRASIAPSWDFDDAPSRKHTGGLYEVEFTGWRKQWLRLVAGLRLVLYSSASIQHLAPFALLLVAIGISAWKVVSA